LIQWDLGAGDHHVAHATPRRHRCLNHRDSTAVTPIGDTVPSTSPPCIVLSWSPFRIPYMPQRGLVDLGHLIRPPEGVNSFMATRSTSMAFKMRRESASGTPKPTGGENMTTLGPLVRRITQMGIDGRISPSSHMPERAVPPTTLPSPTPAITNPNPSGLGTTSSHAHLYVSLLVNRIIRQMTPFSSSSDCSQPVVVP
jgi:hypothetical protein